MVLDISITCPSSERVMSVPLISHLWLAAGPSGFPVQMASNEGGQPAPVAGLRRLSRRKSVSDHLATQGGDPIVYGKIARLKSLVQQKVDKLDTQRRLAEQANNILCRKDVRAPRREHGRMLPSP